MNTGRISCVASSESYNENLAQPLSNIKKELITIETILSFSDPFATKKSIVCKNFTIIPRNDGNKVHYHQDTEYAIARLEKILIRLQKLFDEASEYKKKYELGLDPEIQSVEKRILVQLEKGALYLHRNHEILNIQHAFLTKNQ